MNNPIVKSLILFRSIVFCLRYLPLKQAIKIPIQIGFNMNVYKMYKGGIVIDTPAVKRYMINLGIGGSPCLQQYKGGLMIEKGSHIVLHGDATFSEGFSIRIENDSTLSIGKSFYGNKNCYIRCAESVSIGQDCIFGWNISINDIDGHRIYKGGELQPDRNPVVIADHVWLTSNVKVTKGAVIPKNCVVAQSSVVAGNKYDENSLLGGIPAKVIADNINWSR